MNKQVIISRRAETFSALLCAPALFVLGGTAHAETRASLTVSAGATVSNNPYLEAGAGSAAAGVTLEASPEVIFEQEATTVSLYGNARLNHYFQRYGSDLAGTVGLAVRHRASDRITLNAGAGFQTSRSGLRDRFFSQNTGSSGSVANELFIPDTTLIGQRVRSNSFFSSVGVTFQPSARDTFNLDAGFNRFWSRSVVAQDYNIYRLRAGYSRKLTDRTSAWVSLAGSRSDYVSRRRGDGNVITPMAGIEHKLNDRLTLTAGAGASIANIDDGTGIKRRTTGLALNASLCQQDSRGSYCLSAQRQAQPTAFGDVRNVLNIGFNMSRKISEKNDISITSGYSRNDETGVGVVGNADYLSFGASFSHRFNQRFQAFISPHYDQVLRSSIPRRANYGVSAGVRYVFGAVR